MYDIVVLGAGIVGLSTAVNIQQHVPDSRVTIVADKLLEETTSDGAAGIFRVTLDLTPTASVERYRKWCEDSFRWYHKLQTDYDPAQTGVLRVSGYQINSQEKPNPFHYEFMFNFRELTERELHSIPGNHKYGWFYTTLMTESRRYLPFLTDLFVSNGGRVEKREVKDITEFAGKCRLLVNCAGFKSRELFRDKSVYPVRGHLLRVKAPWVRHFYIFNNGETYIYPGQDNVVLGGTRGRDEHDLTMSDHWYDDIMARCSQLVPGLKKAEVVRRWAGLRPHRSELRVEPETIPVGGNMLHVVHNYGHGANGIALSWGTALEAASIAQEFLQNINTKSKL